VVAIKITDAKDAGSSLIKNKHFRRYEL